jgi:hypothetical protein
MNERKAMEDFNWVDALSHCSLERAFERLKVQVGEDVKQRKDQLKKDSANYTVELWPDGSSFAVAVVGNGIKNMGVKFLLADKAIEVRNAEDKTMFEATLTLNDDGECRLMVNGQEKEFWQFRKLTLEKLLFTSPWNRSAPWDR